MPNTAFTLPELHQYLLYIYPDNLPPRQRVCELREDANRAGKSIVYPISYKTLWYCW